MTEFILGTLASIVAAIVLFIFGKLYAPFSGAWATYVNLLSSLRHLQRAGINNIIPSRTDYRLLKGGETIAKYLSTVQHELIYVGFWHAKGIEMENIKDVFRNLLQKGCAIELVLLSDKINDEKAEIIAKYIGISHSSFRSRLSEAWKFVLELGEEFRSHPKGKFTIKSHSEAIYSSCFIIDQRTSRAKMLVDIKIFGMGRENGFALELVKTSDNNSLYERFSNSFLRIHKSSETVDVEQN